MSNTLENPVVIRRSASKSCRVGFSDPELRSNVLSTSAGGFTTEDTTGDFLVLSSGDSFETDLFVQVEKVDDGMIVSAPFNSVQTPASAVLISFDYVANDAPCVIIGDSILDIAEVFGCKRFVGSVELPSFLIECDGSGTVRCETAKDR